MDAVTRKERIPWLIRLLMGRPAWREVTETNYAGVGGYFTERSVRYLG